MGEAEIFKLIKERIVDIQSEKQKPIRLAINGIEGTGKTIFAGKLTEYLNAAQIAAIQVSIDGFHFNKNIRYKQGRDSAQGYYENSYDEMAFVNKVLKSSQSDLPNYIPATHDLESDEYVQLEPVMLDIKTVIITDGAYLFKPNYRAHWDLKIYLKTDFSTAMERGIQRDQGILGGVDATKGKYEKRYHKASRIYIDKNEPENIADIILDNTDFNNLKLIKPINLPDLKT